MYWLFYLLQMPNGKSLDRSKSYYSGDEGLYLFKFYKLQALKTQSFMKSFLKK